MNLQSNKREVSEKPSVVRERDMIPAVLYGSSVESTPISVGRGPFVALNKLVGSSTIIDLDVDGEEHEVLIKQIDRHPVSDLILHIDFFAIKRGEEMELAVPLVFTGESPATKQGGVINEVLHELMVRCLPRNIPNEIMVDMSTLVDMDTSITIGDLPISSEVTVLASAEDTVVSVNTPQEEPEEVEPTVDDGAETETEAETTE